MARFQRLETFCRVTRVLGLYPPDGSWRSHHMRSDLSVELEERWISIPPSVWHQGVVGPEDWAVVSFHTVSEHELIEERPAAGAEEFVQQRTYAADERHGPAD